MFTRRNNLAAASNFIIIRKRRVIYTVMNTTKYSCYIFILLNSTVSIDELVGKMIMAPEQKEIYLLNF
jgi:hypothetical protein